MYVFPRQLCFTDFVDPVPGPPCGPAHHFSTRMKIPIRSSMITGPTECPSSRCTGGHDDHHHSDPDGLSPLASAVCGPVDARSRLGTRPTARRRELEVAAGGFTTHMGSRAGSSLQRRCNAKNRRVFVSAPHAVCEYQIPCEAATLLPPLHWSGRVVCGHRRPTRRGHAPWSDARPRHCLNRDLAFCPGASRHPVEL